MIEKPDSYLLQIEHPEEQVTEKLFCPFCGEKHIIHCSELTESNEYINSNFQGRCKKLSIDYNIDATESFVVFTPLGATKPTRVRKI